MAKVIKAFKDSHNDSKLYTVGSNYTGDRMLYLAVNGFIEPKQREFNEKELEVIELSKNGELVPVADDNDEKNEHPIHIGGGYYELSNGEKIQGKEKAIETEKTLKE